MIKSKTKIEKQLRRKTNPELVETIILAKKNPLWIEVAQILTMPKRKIKDVNLSDIQNSEGKIIVVPGKVLSQGEISKKVQIAAINFSEKSKEKLEQAGCEVLSIKELILKNKEGKGVTILRK